jgi:hypothetical protein
MLSVCHGEATHERRENEKKIVEQEALLHLYAPLQQKFLNT